MPESVKSRPTKAHEQIFLLSKSRKYFYDWKAISEPVEHPDDSTPEDIARSFSRRRETSPENRQDVCREKPAEVPERKNKRSVWRVPTSPCPEAHFATFPPRLIEPCILAGCPEGGVVLDPFSGAGTTAMVCKELGRKFIGCELNPDYIAISEKRIGKQEVLF